MSNGIEVRSKKKKEGGGGGFNDEKKKIEALGVTSPGVLCN